MTEGGGGLDELEDMSAGRLIKTYVCGTGGVRGSM
jgi:hypothetical protein